MMDYADEKDNPASSGTRLKSLRENNGVVWFEQFTTLGLMEQTEPALELFLNHNNGIIFSGLLFIDKIQLYLHLYSGK